MRPKKRVLIYGAGEIAASVLRLVLQWRGYAVELTAEEARLFAGAADAVLLVGMPDADWQRLQVRLWCQWAQCGVVLAKGRGVEPEAEWIAKILEGVRRGVRRKRGPKPVYARAKRSAHGAVIRKARLREKAAA